MPDNHDELLDSQAQQTDEQAELQSQDEAKLEQHADPEDAGQSEEQDEQFLVPDKFRGKTAEEIIRSYGELEKSFSKKAQEASEAEALRARIAELESRSQQMPVQGQNWQQPQVQQEEQDPFADFRTRLSEDPEGAIEGAVKTLREEINRVKNHSVVQAKAAAAQSYYEQQMKDNQEFRELEPEMTKLAQQYSRLVKPEELNTPETMQLLYEVAKARNLPKYVSRELEKTKSKTNEKRQAFSESSHSDASAGGTPFEALSLEEMEKLLGRIDRS